MFDNKVYITDGAIHGSKEVTVYCNNVDGTLVRLRVINKFLSNSIPLSKYKATFTFVDELIEGDLLEAFVVGQSVQTPIVGVVKDTFVSEVQRDRVFNTYSQVSFENEKLVNFEEVTYKSEII